MSRQELMRLECMTGTDGLRQPTGRHVHQSAKRNTRSKQVHLSRSSWATKATAVRPMRIWSILRRLPVIAAILGGGRRRRKHEQKNRDGGNLRKLDSTNRLDVSMMQWKIEWTPCPACPNLGPQEWRAYVLLGNSGMDQFGGNAGECHNYWLQLRRCDFDDLSRKVVQDLTNGAIFENIRRQEMSSVKRVSATRCSKLQ